MIPYYQWGKQIVRLILSMNLIQKINIKAVFFILTLKPYCLHACRYMIDSINVPDSYNSLDRLNHLDLNQRRWWIGITASSNHQQNNNIVKH
jgi:hypothetical protein